MFNSWWRGPDTTWVTFLETLILITFTVLTAGLVLPQAHRLWVTRDPSGISVAGLLNGAVGYTAWVIYLGWQQDWVPAAATGFAWLVWVGTTWYVVKAVGTSRGSIAMMCGYFVMLSTAALVDLRVFGIVLSLGAVYSAFPAVVEAWRAEHIRGVSVGTWALYVAESLSWLAWALVVHDFVLGLYGLLAALMGMLVLAALAVRSEARQPFVGPLEEPASTGPDPSLSHGGAGRPHSVWSQPVGEVFDDLLDDLLDDAHAPQGIVG